MNLKFYFENRKVIKDGKHYTNYYVVIYTDSTDDGDKRIIGIIPVKPSFYQPSYFKMLDLISREVK